MRNLALLTCLAACRGATAEPLLKPVKAAAPAAEWRRQLLAAPTYHGTFTREVTEAGKVTVMSTGTLASDPAHRKLHVHTSTKMSAGSDHYARDVDLVIDGTQVQLAGASRESTHTSILRLSPRYSADAPFGEISNADAPFTFAGDLRQTLLDCLEAPLEATKVAREWHAAGTAERARDRMTARHDPALGRRKPYDPCADVVFEAGPDTTLHGIRIRSPEDAIHEASVEVTRFELFAGADDREFEIR